MSILTNIEKHLTSVRKFNGYTYFDVLKQGILFPYDYFFRKGKSCMPLNIALFLTLRCNARCEMCNLKELLNKDREELSLEKIDEFLKEVKKFKPSIVLFGGEPILRSDFIDILRKVKSYDLSCGIFTNGTLFSPEVIKKIVELKMNFVAFSLQGIGETHDKIVGIKGAYNRIINAIKEFSKYPNKKTKIILHTTFSEDNLNDLGKIVGLGEKLKVDLIRFGHPTFFTGQDIERNKKVMRVLFPEEKIEEISYAYEPKEKSDLFYKKISDFIDKYKGRFSITPDLTKEEIKDWYSPDFKSKRKCYFVWRGLFIYPNGDVVPCESFRFVMGNINKQKFKDIWNSKKFIKFRKGLKNGLYPGCARCCKL
ncbi:MAG: radical SAM protein [Nanoarchaeota archaeon]|nr:radical SAM protein [Nanoarchaeota archaeon]